ncbi:MAG: hypothetical protein GY906_11110 [bacterium]|nr:hypothetical protein [bacterium]
MTATTRNRLIIGTALILIGGFIAVQMYFSLTPPTHADHDHGMASLDAGGFLWIKSIDGSRRNLVGQPGVVLILHWFDPTTTDGLEQQNAAQFAATVSDDPMVEVVFIARAASADGLASWAEEHTIESTQLYYDKDGRTADLCGVRRWPETLLYDPFGVLAYQAKGSANWEGSAMLAQVEHAKGGVEEIH